MPMKLDFKAIAESVDVEAVASHLRIPLRRSGNELRAACPTCKSDDDRSLAVYPETNSYRCYAAAISGDCISLWAHINGYTGMYRAAKELSELFAHASAARPDTAPETLPQKPQGASPSSASTAAPARPKAGSVPFDPQKFAAGLQYTEEVAALGVTEDLARQYRIGVHRGKLYAPICPADVEPQTWMECSADGKFRLPAKWLQPTVVPFKRRA